MRVSVVLCTYSMDRYEVFSDAVESVLAQTHDPVELVVVVDGNETLLERFREDFGEADDHERIDDLIVHCNARNRGISYSRTKGAKLATGDVVAFIDDDAVAHDDWVERLVETYETTDAVAVGGHVRPEWLVPEPPFFPEEFNWLVGCDERGFGEHMEELRNTYGSNISYRRDVFLSVGGYDENTGRKGDRHIQAHEAPVCIRIRKRYGKGVIYNREAVVDHRMFAYRADPKWLVSRAFWQGYSKRIMSRIVPDMQGNEEEYLRRVFLAYVPERAVQLVRNPSAARLQQLAMIFVFTAAVALGYLRAVLTPNLVDRANE